MPLISAISACTGLSVLWEHAFQEIEDMLIKGGNGDDQRIVISILQRQKTWLKGENNEFRQSSG